MGTGIPPGGPVYPPLSMLLGTPGYQNELGAANALFGYTPASTLLSAAAVSNPPKPPYQWFYLTRRFNALFSALELTDKQCEDGDTKT
jgi:hypothetical protein